MTFLSFSTNVIDEQSLFKLQYRLDAMLKGSLSIPLNDSWVWDFANVRSTVLQPYLNVRGFYSWSKRLGVLFVDTGSTVLIAS